MLCLLPCWEAFPEGLREGFPRLREKLSDDDPGVVGATVGVVMELARRQGGEELPTVGAGAVWDLDWKQQQLDAHQGREARESYGRSAP